VCVGYRKKHGGGSEEWEGPSSVQGFIMDCMPGDLNEKRQVYDRKRIIVLSFKETGGRGGGQVSQKIAEDSTQI